MKKITFYVFLITVIFASCNNENSLDYQQIGKELCDGIDQYYYRDERKLFNETYPYKEDLNVTYLSGEDMKRNEKVAYLWPTSGVLSAYVALYRSEPGGDLKGKIDELITHTLSQYYTNKSYASYLNDAGHSDSFYDDNIWLAIDFCEMFLMTKEQKYLTQSLVLWDFIRSGYDSRISGGIYWCQEKKKTKNTCSNAPATVLCCKLYEATKNRAFLIFAKELYNWTKITLQDTDYLYWDNIDLKGKIDERKYCYNSGQMIQAGVLLYEITKEESYLNDARRTAKAAMDKFTTKINTGEDAATIIDADNNWFVSIFLRGYFQLYNIDKEDQYLKLIKNNVDWIIENRRDDHGLYEKKWADLQARQTHKWLADQTSIVEIMTSLYNALN